MMADLQGFLQAFPNSGCLSPRISKESFGGFTEFQKVTRVPNPKSPLPNFFAASASFWTYFRLDRAAFRPASPRVERAHPTVEIRKCRGPGSSWASIRVEGNLNLARIPISGKKCRRFCTRRVPHPESASTSELAGRRTRFDPKRPVNRAMARNDFPGRHGVEHIR
jgi:hypothetical protein